jgi:hypothetical protein
MLLEQLERGTGEGTAFFAYKDILESCLRRMTTKYWFCGGLTNGYRKEEDQRDYLQYILIW